jgi:hypothetical protein
VHLIDAEPARHRFGRGPAVAGEHDDSNPGVMQKTNRFRRRWLDRIGDADQARQLLLNRNEHDRLTFRAHLLGAVTGRICRYFHLLEQFEISQRDSVAADDAIDSLARGRLETLMIR